MCPITCHLGLRSFDLEWMCVGQNSPGGRSVRLGLQSRGCRDSESGEENLIPLACPTLAYGVSSLGQREGHSNY